MVTLKKEIVIYINKDIKGCVKAICGNGLKVYLFRVCVGIGWLGGVERTKKTK